MRYSTAFRIDAFAKCRRRELNIDASNQKIEYIYPTFFSREIAPEAKPIRSALLQQIIQKSKDSPSETRSNKGGWHSQPNFFDWSNETICLKGFLEVRLKKLIAKFVGTCPPYNLKITGWANVTYSGGFNFPHIHAGSLLSGCLYLDIGDSSEEMGGQLAFLDPRGVAEAGVRPGSFLSEGKTLTHIPEDLQLIVFPSWLKHFVVPYVGKTPRVSIAFNVFPP